MKNIASRQNLIALSREPPFPVDNGFHIPPEDVREAVRFATQGGVGRVKKHWWGVAPQAWRESG